MRIIALCLAVFGVFLSLATPEAQTEEFPPEAAAVIAVLKAVKESDVNAFKNAYSRQIREDKNQGDWEKNLKEAKANLQKLYGDYQVGDFTFTYEGGEEKGKVTFTHKTGKELDLEVIKEDGKWKVDMR